MSPRVMRDAPCQARGGPSTSTVAVARAQVHQLRNNVAGGTLRAALASPRDTPPFDPADEQKVLEGNVGD